MKTVTYFFVTLLTLHLTLTASAEHREWKRRKLRGYGQISAGMESGNKFSVLKIDCESPEKASIIHAKFIQDLRALGQVKQETRAVNGIDLPLHIIGNKGAVSAWRKNKKVTIVSGRDESAWRKGMEELEKDLRKAVLNPDAEVPMYLNSWDQYGFRFYYRPWETPGRDVKWADYHVLKEFDFSKEQNNRGFVFWAETANIDNAVGLDNDNWWNWGARAAERRNLPIIINTMNVQPTWLLNGYRNEGMALMPQFCGSYHGIAKPSSAGMRSISWCADEAKDRQLEPIRRIAQRYCDIPQTLEYLEPHGELRHGDYDIFLEYGPLADKSFQKFLKEKYGRLSKLTRRWKKEDSLHNWNDVRVPDLAEFLGYNQEAFDLTGEWHIGYEPLKDQAAEWSRQTYDDSKWPVLQAPGNQLMMFLERKPAVFRRSFKLPAGWLKKGDKAWLYIWDLNRGEHLKDKITASLNGKVIGEDLTRHATSHWGAYESTGVLKEGINTVAISVPQGFLGYHVYLSKEPPLQYPGLPEGKNEQWVDFADWRQATRLKAARRGIEAIRSVDPDRSIICMAPDSTIAGIKKLCEEYGARFHNTGHMGAFWNEFLSMLMRGSDLPFSLEPGGPAKDLEGFKRMMGRYFTEGIQAIHYFIHVGSIYWNGEIRNHFEKTGPMINTIGKVHAPKAEIAMLFSDRIDNLTGFPWGQNPDINLPTGYFSWPLNSFFTGKYDFDGLTGLDFADGNADPYKIIIGANTSIIDDTLTGEIEKWVRKGGIFVAFVQTGRHTPEKQDAWPISKLSGYKVTEISENEFTPREPYEVKDWWRVSFAPGQQVFKESEWELKDVKANGLKLRPSSSDCENLMLWEDGSTAIGMRKLGKGYVIHMGLKFCRVPLWHGWRDRTEKLFGQLFQWADIEPLPASAENINRFRHYVSNNGLWDIWTLWNDSKDSAVETSLVFHKTTAPAFCREIRSGSMLELTRNDQGKAMVENIKLEPLETKIFITPKTDIETAAAQWFDLQCNWWRGTADVKKRKAPEGDSANAQCKTGYQATLDLTDGWHWKALDENGSGDPSVMAETAFDDSAWPIRRLECWAVPDEIPSRRVMFRRNFKVPQKWNNGETELWIKAWFAYTTAGKARYWIDGKEISQGDGRNGLIVNSKFEADSEHTLAAEVTGEGDICGIRGNTWLSFTKAPDRVMDLAGTWIPSSDLLDRNPPIELPGKFNAKLLERTFTVDDLNDEEVYLHLDGGYGITGCIINGQYVRRHHHALGEITHLNITPWIKGGNKNVIEILTGGRGELRKVELWIY